jgi:hypothetical protein
MSNLYDLPAFSFVNRLKICSSHANPISLLDQPVGDEVINTSCFPTSISSTHDDLISPLAEAKIAAKYSVDRRTLARRHQGASISCAAKAENQQALHPQQEQELLRYIERLTRQGLPPTRSMIRRFASEIAKKELGVHWVDRFVTRYKVELISQWATGIDRSRHQADSQSKYSPYFELLRSKLNQYNIEPRHTYNMDEKGFMLGVLTRSKRIFSKRLYEEGKIKAHNQDGNREWITLVACICADGSALSSNHLSISLRLNTG